MVEALQRFWRTAKAHPKSTAAGCALIVMVLHSAIENPLILLTADPYEKLIGGFGLLFVADSVSEDDEDEEPPTYGFGQ